MPWGCFNNWELSLSNSVNLNLLPYLTYSLYSGRETILIALYKGSQEKRNFLDRSHK